MTLFDFVTTFLRKMLSCQSLEAVHQQIQHLSFIVNLGENLCARDLELILSEHQNVIKEIDALAHLLTSDKGGEDVHLLLLAAVHLEIEQPLKES